MDSAGHSERWGCAPFRFVELLHPFTIQVFQSISVKLLQNELYACAECGLHDAEAREFVMQNVEDK